MKYKAFGKNILVEPFKKEMTTKSGLVLAHEIDDRSPYIQGEGKVLSVSEDIKGIEVGCKVYFKSHHQTEIGDLWSIPQDAILGYETI